MGLVNVLLHGRKDILCERSYDSKFLFFCKAFRLAFLFAIRPRSLQHFRQIFPSLWVNFHFSVG